MNTSTVLWPLVAVTALAIQASGADGPDFTKDVAPILTKYCTGCHNDTDREGKLSLQSYEALLKGGAKGGVVTPGQTELSRLIRVLTGAAKPAMPPEGEEAPKPTEIEVLKGWIAAGAKGPSRAAVETALVVPKVKLLAAPKLSVNSIALSPDGKILAIARDNQVELQSLADRSTLRTFGEIPGSVNGVSFSTAGQTLVAAAGEPGLFGEARIYRGDDDGTRSVPTTFRGHKDSLYCNGAVFELAFRGDGKVLASASGDRTVKLWEVGSGQRLDTLKESQKELYAMAFSPDGTRLAAAGVDNRIRVWRIAAEAKEGTNPLLISKFAHEMPILRLVWSADGRTLASAGEDRLVKIWNADSMTIRQTLEKQPDWASGLAISADGRTLVVGRVDGSIGVYSIAPPSTGDSQPLVPFAEVPPEVDYGPQPAIDMLPKVAEVEPNNEPEQAASIATPGMATGRIFVADGGEARDEDLFRFDAKAGDQWIIETKAARAGTPLDTRLEVLDAGGQPVPRLLLRAVRDSVIEFRGMNSEQRGVRLANWEEMLLNEYVYLSGDVIKLFQQRRGPDADAQFYPENGNRFAYFDTTSRAHTLGEPAYIVVPYAIGTELPNNGLPVFTMNYENDDDSQRKLGKDSKLTFVAPADGTYFVRVTDVRGFSGDKYTYEVTIRRPQPDFKVTLTGDKPTINAGSGKPFTVKAERIDNFNGSIRVDIAEVPSGLHVTTPIVIQEGHHEASGVIKALDGAEPPSEEQLKAIKITATATVCAHERTKDVSGFGTIKLAAKPKVVVHLEPLNSEGEVIITPGGSTKCKLRVEREGFEDRIAFDVANLPH
ncbi:MAG: hypothetical protein JF612_06470, partial [Planctomycetia bacterium]|nr:hypothetical protein [Planctomycetia bacterium]